MEVGNVIYEHPAVLEAAAVGIPHEYRGETVKAFIALKPQFQGKVTEQEIIDFCRDKLANYKVPRDVEFIEAIPKNVVGKALRRVLKQREIEKAQKRKHDEPAEAAAPRDADGESRRYGGPDDRPDYAAPGEGRHHHRWRQLAVQRFDAAHEGSGGEGNSVYRDRRFGRRRGRPERAIDYAGVLAAWPHVKPIFQAIAAKVEDGTPCCDGVGEEGAGHYVKMVHNGIEYGDMQLKQDLN